MLHIVIVRLSLTVTSNFKARALLGLNLKHPVYVSLFNPLV